MARESQKENGSWAALPRAATRTPAATTSRQPALLPGRSARASPAPPASAAPAATYRPRSAARVVTKAVRPEDIRCGSRHQKPMSAYDVAPMTSQASSSVGSVSATAVSNAAAANTSISPWNRPRDSRISPPAKTRTSRVTAAIVGTTTAASASTPSARSVPAMKGTPTRGCSRATTVASTRVSAAVPRETGVATRSLRAPTVSGARASTAPTTAGRSTRSHSEG